MQRSVWNAYRGHAKTSICDNRHPHMKRRKILFSNREGTMSHWMVCSYRYRYYFYFFNSIIDANGTRGRRISLWQTMLTDSQATKHWRWIWRKEGSFARSNRALLFLLLCNKIRFSAANRKYKGWKTRLLSKNQNDVSLLRVFFVSTFTITPGHLT